MQPEPGDHPFRERLRRDHTLWLELSYCAEHGLPHSAFLSWDPIDRAKALAYLLEMNARCTLCGSADWEWEADRFAYEVIEHRCQGCYLKEQAALDNKTGPGVTLQLASTRDEAAKRRREVLEALQRRGD